MVSGSGWSIPSFCLEKRVKKLGATSRTLSKLRAAGLVVYIALSSSRELPERSPPLKYASDVRFAHGTRKPARPLLTYVRKAWLSA